MSSGDVPIRPFMDFMRRIEEAGLTPEDLDNLVHDLKSNEASDINNAGLAQVLEQEQVLVEALEQSQLAQVLESESELAQVLEKL